MRVVSRKSESGHIHPQRSSWTDDLPGEWKLLPIGRILINAQYGTNAASTKSGSTEVVGMKDIQDGRVFTSNLARADLPAIEREKFLLERGDLLINRTNSYELVGKVGIYENDRQAAFASYLVRMKVDRELVLPEFLNYWLNGSIAQQAIKRLATRAIGQANINPSVFKKHCLVPLPPLPDQAIIAETLSAWDLAIEKTERLIAAKDRRFSGLLQKLIDANSGS